MTPRFRPLEFVAIDDLDGKPHVLLDGATRAATTLTLSHWPASATPDALRADLSTQSALAYLDAPVPIDEQTTCATIDHLDEDALCSLLCVVQPAQALERRGPLVALARAGDFDVLETRDAGRAAWALRSRWRAGGLEAPSAALSDDLGLLVELLDRPERFAALWREEDERYELGARALERGLLELEERPELDVAVVTCASALPAGARTNPGDGRVLPVHPAVLHSATTASRILVVQGRRYCYYDRYESWVAYRSRALPGRRDLTVLVPELEAAERAGTRWHADPPGALVASLRSEMESSLEPAEVLAMLVAHLERAPSAWFPHAVHPLANALSRSGGPREGTSDRGRPRWRGLGRRSI